MSKNLQSIKMNFTVIDQITGNYHYHAASSIEDTVNDTRHYNSSGWIYTETCTVDNVTKGSGTWIKTNAKRTISLIDSAESEGSGSYIDLLTGKSGRGSIVFGDAAGYCDFVFTTAGVVSLLTQTSANVFTTLQTGTNHVIIKDNGSNVRITNELGATTNFSIDIKYTN